MVAAKRRERESRWDSLRSSHQLVPPYVVRLGIGNMNAKTAHELEEQAKQLGNAYLPGAQAALRNYTKLFYSDRHDELPVAEREGCFSEALDQLCRLHALIGKDRTYLERRLEDPELAPETQTSIAAWLVVAEASDYGLVSQNLMSTFFIFARSIVSSVKLRACDAAR